MSIKKVIQLQNMYTSIITKMVIVGFFLIACILKFLFFYLYDNKLVYCTFLDVWFEDLPLIFNYY